jgi:hypothetical protein
MLSNGEKVYRSSNLGDSGGPVFFKDDKETMMWGNCANKFID